MTNNRINNLMVIFDQFIVSGSNFITGFILARYIGVEGYGQYVLAYGFLLFVSGLQVAVIISPMMVMGSRLNADKCKAYFWSLFSVQIFFNFMGCVCVYVAGYFVDSVFPDWNLKSLVLPLAIATFCFLTQDYLRRYYIVTSQNRLVLFSDFFFHGFRVAGLVYFGNQSELTSELAFKILILSSLVPISLGILHVIISTKQIRKVVNSRKIITDHWHFGKWLVANNLSYWGSNQLIIYMVAGLVSVTSVGGMYAALNVIGVANILYLALENIVPAQAARTYKESGGAGLNHYLIRVCKFGGSVTITIIFIACIWAEGWMRLLYGEKFTEYSWMIYLWALYYAIGFFHRPLSAGLKVLNDTKGIFISNLLSPVLVVSMGYWTINNYKVAGALVILCAINLIILLSMLYRYNVRVKKTIN